MEKPHLLIHVFLVLLKLKGHSRLIIGILALSAICNCDKGCYLWNADGRIDSIEFDLKNKEECQIRCPQSKYEFFCLQENVGPNVDGDNFNCIAVECRHHDRIFTAENCDSMYNVICENTKKRSARILYNATTFCENEDSFVRCNPSLSCTSTKESVDSKHWTSIKNSKQMFPLTANDENISLRPSQCNVRETSKDRNKFVEPSFVSCNELRTFYCRYGSRPSVHNASKESPEQNVTMELPDNGHITRYIIPGIIVGIVGSVIIIILITVVIIAFMFRRKHSRKLLSFSTIIKNEPSTSRMDSNTVTAAYEQLNKTDTDNITHCQSYDQLIVHEEDKTIKHNNRISREEEGTYESIEEPIEKYYDALTAEYEQLEQSEITKIANVYNPLHYTPVEDSDPTNARSNTIISREEKRKYDTSQIENKSHENVFPLEYEQLDITKTDTSTNVYDQLHVTNTAGKQSTNDRPKLIVSGGKDTNVESTKDKNEFDSRIVPSEYEQLDITYQDKITKAYDQLHFKHAVVTEPTDEHCNN